MGSEVEEGRWERGFKTEQEGRELSHLRMWFVVVVVVASRG